MRPFLKNMGLMVVAVMMLATGTASASTLEVAVPFPFVVQGRTLPAGQYRVTNEDGVVLLRGEKGTQAIANAFTIPASGQDPAGSQPTLVFHRYENQYRLTDIWQSSTQGREVAR